LVERASIRDIQRSTKIPPQQESAAETLSLAPPEDEMEIESLFLMYFFI
jgi:hypothetical protein